MANPVGFRESTYQPNITQRSIIAAARKRMEGIQTSLDTVRVMVDKPLQFFGSAEEAALALEWDKPGYVVTFRRNGQEWEVIEVL